MRPFAAFSVFFQSRLTVPAGFLLSQREDLGQPLQRCSSQESTDAF